MYIYDAYVYVYYICTLYAYYILFKVVCSAVHSTGTSLKI